MSLSAQKTTYTGEAMCRMGTDLFVLAIVLASDLPVRHHRVAMTSELLPVPLLSAPESSTFRPLMTLKPRSPKLYWAPSLQVLNRISQNLLPLYRQCICQKRCPAQRSCELRD